MSYAIVVAQVRPYSLKQNGGTVHEFLRNVQRTRAWRLSSAGRREQSIQQKIGRHGFVYVPRALIVDRATQYEEIIFGRAVGRIKGAERKRVLHRARPVGVVATIGKDFSGLAKGSRFKHTDLVEV